MADLKCPDGCGKCCDPVMMPYTLDDVRRMLPGQMAPSNRDFILAHFTQIPRREGLVRSPYVVNGGRTHMLVLNEGTGQMTEVEDWSHFFECDVFDPVTKRCTDYENRPPLCRDYPLYGDSIDSESHKAKRLPEGCVYLPDPVRR